MSLPYYIRERTKRYPKKTKVKIKLDGTKNNQGDFNVTEIIEKL